MPRTIMRVLMSTVLLWFFALTVTDCSSRVARNVNPFTYPGTNYCGTVNVVSTVAPPRLPREDACCKAHQECPNIILPGQTDATSGLTNICTLPQKDCTCEDTLFKCLKSIGSFPSYIIGSLYFNGLTRNCYTNAVPVKCKVFWQKIQPTTCQTCLNYCTDTTAAPAWHWRPTALYLLSSTALTQPPPC